jgi:hypothetical protein
MWSIITYTNAISGKVIYIAAKDVPKDMKPSMADVTANLDKWKPEIFETKEKAEAFIKSKWNICSDCGGTVCDCCYTSEEMEKMGFWQPPK